MPELPEVELLRRGISQYVEGLTLGSAEVRTPKIFEGDPKQVIGGKVIGVRRFGKMLSIDLSHGMSLAIHVKMTGRLIYRGEKQPELIDIEPELTQLPSKHTHVIFVFTNGDRLYYNDVRKFGWIKVVKTVKIEELPFVRKLGPEPLGTLSQDRFEEILVRFGRPIKTLLMDQERISGVGNIYANEALFCAGLAPMRKANDIDDLSVRRLYECILKVLKEGIAYGGSSTDSFRDVLGRKGGYQEHYLVYDREGEACKRKGCSGTVKKRMMSGRGTYWCPKCQM